MRFSHTADCHVGGHRDPRLKALTEKAFQVFIDESTEQEVDFIIIAGDLFNTAIPGIDTLKFVVAQLGKAKQNGIPVYAIPGSHDFSPSGKTMLDVLEEAGLLINVCRGQITDEGKLKLKFTIDKKTGAKLTGVIGKKGMLDRQIYNDLDTSIENESGKKIFLFHTSLTELKPKHLQEMESFPISFLPKGFDYYAGGHVHITERYSEKGHENVVYPGPLFPNSFSELEKLKHGTYYLYDDNDDKSGVCEIEKRDIDLAPVIALNIDAEGKSAQETDKELRTIAHNTTPSGAIVLLRLEGTLSSGSQGDIDIRDAVKTLEENGALVVLRSTSRLSSSEFSAIQLRHDEPKNIEEDLLAEHSAELSMKDGDGTNNAKMLLAALGREIHEGEKQAEYQDNVIKEALSIIDSSKR